MQPDDTLTTIAAAVGQGATPSWIVTTQLHTAQVLQRRDDGGLPEPGRRLLTVRRQDQPGGQPAHPSPPNSLTFLFHTASNTAFSNLALQLRYQVNQIEYGIQDVAWATGYQSSQWLTFLLPPDNAPIGTVDVPVPLRAHPVPPSVTSQRMTPRSGAQSAPALQQLRRYDYDYTFSTQRAAQDSVSTSQLQNTLLADGTPLTAPAAELPTALAQYATVRDGLEQDLALLTGVNPVAPVTVPPRPGTPWPPWPRRPGSTSVTSAGSTPGRRAAPGRGNVHRRRAPSVTVAAGDTLAGIAARLGADVDPSPPPRPACRWPRASY